MSVTTDIYKELEHNDLGILKDKDIGQTMIQNTVLETLKNNYSKTKYIIQLESKRASIKKKKEINITKKRNVAGRKKEDSSEMMHIDKIDKMMPIDKIDKMMPIDKIDKMNKTFEDMMVQFQHMVQLNQLIQMNQMNQIQIMNQLVELKGNVIETRQDLSFKLKELNQRIDDVSSKRTSNNNGSGNRSKKEKEEEVIDNEDYSHLLPLKIESAYSLYDHRTIDENYVKNLLRSKNPSAFVKMFDLLYRYKDKSKKDIYPIRVIKAKTFQYYDDEGNWILDTNGTNLIKIICANIGLLFSKINNNYFEGEDLDMFDFVDNQTFIQELDDKKVRNQLLTSIRDIIVNHHMNWKPVKKEEKEKEEKEEKEE